ncbi:MULTISPECIES: hypothetical protein [Enterobacteriaceae]|nr:MULTISPECIES: hypothetical protein [Enterobacteriaceae]UIM03955.1 hypothetical protein LZT43_16845 [Escherichia coli]UMW25527.1 hypothetical protein L6L61_12220 [Escherichia coli]UOQ39925.1 hypothetical protein MUK78_21175 [Escherichia coli]
MNISYVNSNKTTSLPVELDALNNKDISYAKDFFLYIETQLKIAKDFLDLEKKYQVLGNDSNLLIVFYVQIMPDDFVMQLHRF